MPLAASSVIEDVKEISSVFSSLGAGKILSYLVPLDLFKQTLRSTTSTIIKPSQVHLAYSLGSEISISINTQSLAIGFVLNLHNIYQLKSVLNNGFWEDDTHTALTHVYHDDISSLHLIPNFDMYTKTKDINRSVMVACQSKMKGQK